MAGRFSVSTTFKAVDNMSRIVKKMQGNIGRFTNKAGKKIDGLNRRMNLMAQKGKKAFRVLAIGGAIFAGVLANIVNTGADFEQNLLNATAKFPGQIRQGTAAFAELDTAAREVGRSTEFMASQAAEALNFLAMAGFNAEQATAALPGVVDLATAAQIDLGRATDIASDSLGAFNLMTKDTAQLSTNLARVNDVLAKTAASTNTPIELMFEAIGEVGPIATATGSSVEQLSALIGKLADAKIKGSRAGTTLKNMFVRLAAPSATAAKLLRKLGVQTKDSAGDLNSITKIIGQLNKGLEGIGTADKAAALNEIFGRIPIAGVNVLLNQGQAELEAYTKRLEGATGAAKEMAGVMRSSTANSLKTLMSAVESVKISIFSMTKGPLNDLIKNTTEWVRANEQVIATGVAEYIVKIFDAMKFLAENGATILKVTGWVIGLVLAFKAVAAILTIINLIMAANPVVLAVMAIIAAVALLITFWDDLMVMMVKYMSSPLLSPLITIATAVGNLFGGDEEEESASAATPQVTTSATTISQRMESIKRNESRVILEAKPGTVATEDGRLSDNISIMSSGAF